VEQAADVVQLVEVDVGDRVVALDGVTPVCVDEPVDADERAGQEHVDGRLVGLASVGHVEDGGEVVLAGADESFQVLFVGVADCRKQGLLDVGQGEGIGKGNVGDALDGTGSILLVIGTCGLQSSQRELTTLRKSCMSTRKRHEYCIIQPGRCRNKFLEGQTVCA
jgi:hypothetical protein